MHGAVAAGSSKSLAFDDDGEAHRMLRQGGGRRRMAKVLEGVYTGFSMGGQYVKRWKDETHPQLTRYTPRPSEVSLVDNPCIPPPTFERNEGGYSKGVDGYRRSCALDRMVSVPTLRE